MWFPDMPEKSCQNQQFKLHIIIETKLFSIFMYTYNIKLPSETFKAPKIHATECRSCLNICITRNNIGYQTVGRASLEGIVAGKEDVE